MTIANPPITAAELALLVPELLAVRGNVNGTALGVDRTETRDSKNNRAEEHKLEQTVIKKTAPLLMEMSMDEFLQSIERRAFHMARIATGNRDDALDIVQEAMFKLVQKYSAKTASEWRPLFYRILNRKITDHYRRNAVKNRLFSLASFGMKSSDQGADLIDRAEGRKSDAPDATVARELQMEILSKAVAQLPGRQRQAFILRCWDGMSTAITAETMGCSQGSVKTHYSRAMHSLRASLEDYRYE